MANCQSASTESSSRPEGSSSDGAEVCHVGAQLHLQAGVPDETYLRHLRAFVEEGMADYVLLVAYSLDEAALDAVAQYLRDHKVHFFLQEKLNPNEWRYSRKELDGLRMIAGDLFLGIHWGELDSSGLRPEDYLPEKVYRDPTRRAVKEALLERIRCLVDKAHERGVPVGHSSALLYHHIFAEAGVDIICSEIGENIPNAGMMIGANRGTARAYGRRWMIDHSTWWSPRGNAGKQVSPREGHTPWCMFTTLLAAAMGGADFVQLEVDWAVYPEDSLFRPGRDKPAPLLPWGRALKTLFSLTRRIGPRGGTVTPFAILLGHENGWPGVGWRTGDVRATGLFDGHRHMFMQTRDSDLSLKVLDVFYPGFERCGWDPEYPGFLAESPFGQLDIVPDNLPPQSYSRYDVLVALGYHRMTDGLSEALTRFVKGGGVLICGDTMFRDEHENLVEADLAEPLIGCRCDWRGDPIHLVQPVGYIDAIEGLTVPASCQEWQDHWLRPVQLTAGRVVARLDDAPYVIETRLGTGRVFFVTGLNMVGSDARRRGPEPFLYANTLYRFLHALKDHVGDGIQFTPWTSLEYVYNRKADGTAMLLVMNHGDMPYTRDLRMKNPDGFARAHVIAKGTWEGWSAGSAVNLSERGGTLAWSFDLPPKSFILFELSP